MKKVFFTVLLVVVMTLSLVACSDTKTDITTSENTTNIQEEKNDDYKWLLTSKIYRTSPDNANSLEADLLQEYYKYDSSGRLEEHYIMQAGARHTNYSDFIYDSCGRLVSEKSDDLDWDTDEIKFNNHFYDYDNAGNVIKHTISYFDGDITTFTYVYDEKNNVVEEIEDNGSFTSKTQKNLIYDGDKCIRADILSKTDSSISNGLEIYEYDENGNLYSIARYFDFSSGENTETITVAGTVYYLFDITFYAYEKFLIETEVNNSSNQTITANTSATTTTVPATTQVKKLSDSCDKVMATGKEENGDVYELVANQTSDYDSVKIELGVIKNNEWLVELHSDWPFLTSDGLLRNSLGLASDIYGDKVKFIYVGNGCFHNYYHLYNSKTNQCFRGLEFNDDSSSYSHKYAILCSATKWDEEGRYLVQKMYDSVIYCLDSNTMTLTEIPGDWEDCEFTFLSEGLFLCNGGKSYSKHKSGFYNLNGEKVIDLTQFEVDLDEEYKNMYFDDGKCTFTVENSIGERYNITIDKTGEVINQIKL